MDQEQKQKKINSLTELQRKVTQEEATEFPFDNAYYNNQEEGIYVDVVTGRPLFSTTHQYDAGCGWPSFYDTIDPKAVETKEDRKLITPRTEVHSVDDTHLGHIFKDGPKDKTGLRFCINSASLKFIPKEDLTHPRYEGKYEKYLSLFE